MALHGHTRCGGTVFLGRKAIIVDNAPRSNHANLMQVQQSPDAPPRGSKQRLKPRKPGWRVVLGRVAWSRYTYERPEGDALKLLGSISKGAQVGALAITLAGDYVQVVGDYLVPLKTKEIAKALANAPKESNPEFSTQILPQPTPRKTAPPPVIIVKKRRIIPDTPR